MPGYKFKCPYCFREMMDNEVHFRSERVSDDNDNPLPAQFYGDYDSFVLNYNGSDKQQIQSRYEEWQFFKKGKDEIYENFWENFKGVTTERKSESAKKIEGNFENYERKVIAPYDRVNEKYLEFEDNLFEMDEHGMVQGIRVKDDIKIKGMDKKKGKLCSRRVCPYCQLWTL